MPWSRRKHWKTSVKVDLFGSRDHRNMATASMATAAGAAALLYYSMNRKSKSSWNINYDDENGRDVHNRGALRTGRVSYRLIQAPATWSETISTLLETLRFAYSETLGKWPIGDLAFGVGFLLKRQGTLHVSSVFGGKESLRLRSPEITTELRYLLNFLILCRLFSKKTFPLFLEETGYAKDNVLLQKPKAGILMPAFTILADHKMKTFLLLIRGTHSIKDTLTAATGAVVPFHHTVVHKGGVSNLVLGYAHCGMVAAAGWIAKLASPCLIKALDEYPDYKVKIIGHSLGGGTAALLTYILREREEFSTATCVTFGPAACMTWELAESGIDFITTIINGADLVPSFSAASVDDLRAEVMASAWLNDLRSQIERTRIIGTVYRSASALGSRLSSIVSARARVSGAGAISHPVSSGTQPVIAHSAWSYPSVRLPSWSFMGNRRRAATIREDGSALDSFPTVESSQHFLTGFHDTKATDNTTEQLDPSSEGGVQDSEEVHSISDKMGTHFDTDPNLEDREGIMEQNGLEDHMNEVELWRWLENELYNQIEGGEEADLAKKIREEEEAAAAAIAEVAESQLQSSVPEMKEGHRFFPPGKIMHIVSYLTDREGGCEGGGSSTNSGDRDNVQPAEPKVGIFLTPRSLYSKLRLSQSMISDHLMPVYRRQIELLITELEKEQEKASENT